MYVHPLAPGIPLTVILTLCVAGLWVVELGALVAWLRGR